jgi:hypothetical protein
MEQLITTRADLIEIAAIADLDQDSDIHWFYSGRGMYGQTCVGVVGTAQAMRFVVALGDWRATEFDYYHTEAVREFTDDVRTDSMGRNTIYYFPGLTVEREPATV